MSFTDADRTARSTSKRFPAPKSIAGSDQSPDQVQAGWKNSSDKTTQSTVKPTVKQESTPIAHDDPNEQDVAASTYNHSFSGSETEHIKFSAYDPFSTGNDSFTLNLDEAAANFTYPINGKYSSGYGRRGRGTHSGVDLVAPVKTPIYAAFDGTVRLAKPYSGYGNVIVVRHSNGLETVYAHNSKNLVTVGQSVRSGEQIAECGRTGRATTDHLHFEVRIKGQTINPNLLIDPKAKCLQSGTLKVSRSGKGISAKLVGGKEQPEEQIASTDQTASNTAKILTADSNTPTATSPSSSISPSPTQSKGVRVGDTIYDAPTPEIKAESTEKKYHTIVGGDTLSGIAKKYSTTISSLCSLNNMSKNDVIRTGKKIRVK